MNRGGSWKNNAINLRSANHNRNNPSNRNNNLGFRPAKESRPARTCAPWQELPSRAFGIPRPRSCAGESQLAGRIELTPVS